jgi:hypothetical protein
MSMLKQTQKLQQTNSQQQMLPQAAQKMLDAKKEHKHEIERV